MDFLDADTFAKIADVLGLKEVSHNLLYFFVAAWIHSTRVGKEIQKQMSGLISAINAVRDTLQAEISLQNNRIDQMNDRIEKLTQRPPCMNHDKKG